MTHPASAPSHVAFAGPERIASGALAETAAAARHALDADPQAPVLVFDRASGRVVDLDLRGSAAEVAERFRPPAAAATPRRGRPRLGVVAREVTLLPRHWAWLAAQPGGASVALRRLVESALREGDGGRGRRDAAYALMSALAGDLPGFEEASRALFAGDRAGLERRLEPWPAGVREEVLALLDGR